MLGRSRRRGATINQAVAPVTHFGSDPRGTAMFAALAGVAQLGISGHDGLVYTGDQGAPERSWNGDLGRDLQRFTGAAALAMYGAAAPISPTSATFETARAADALTDAPLRIFAARAARGRS
ncbi:MAG: hypothetical protein JWQ32_2071 [Marmoricola sp.]|nr:hypothetical protein [Marmoricola sp.]